MASTIIGAMSVLLGANTKPYTRGMKKASLQTQIMQAQVKALHAVMGQFGMMLGGAFAIGKFKSIAAGVDETAKFSRALGIANEALGGYTLAASLAGVPTTQLRTGMRAMVKSLGDAMQGTGEAKNSLAALGVSMDDIKGKTPEQQFELLRAAFARSDDQMLKATATMDIFGSRNLGIRNMLEMTADEMANVQKQAEKMGVAISGADAKQIEDANDSVTMLAASFDGLLTGTLVRIAPQIESLANSLADFVQDSHGVDALGAAFSAVLWGIEKGGNAVVFVWNGIRHGINSVMEPLVRAAAWLSGSDFMSAWADEVEKEASDSGIAMLESAQAFLGFGSASNGAAVGANRAASAMGDAADEADELTRSVDEAAKAAKKHLDSLRAFADGVIDAAKSPVEKLREELDKLTQAQAAGSFVGAEDTFFRRGHELMAEIQRAELPTGELAAIESAISAAEGFKVELPTDEEFARMEANIRRGFELGVVQTEGEMNRLIGNAFAMTVGKEQADAAEKADKKARDESARAIKEQEDAIKQSADAIRSALETPFEAFVRELQAAEKLVTAKALDPADLVAYEKKLVDEFNKSLGGGETTTRGAFAEVDFSRVSTSALAMQGDRIQSQQLDTQQAIAKHTLETATALRRGITATAA